MGHRSTLFLCVVSVVFCFQGRAADNAARIPVFFVKDSGSRFLAEASGMRGVFSPEGVEYRAGQNRVHTRFLGVRANLAITGVEPSGHANFLVGQEEHGWRTGLPVYRKLMYQQLYPGIDLVYLGTGGRLKSEYHVAAGADPRQIQIEYSEDVSLGEDGVLECGSLRERAPEIYQKSASGQNVPIQGRYRLIDARTVGFEISAYDRSRALVIDPVVSYATYLSGTGLGAVTGVAVDAGGNLYATGWTEAVNFPTVNALQTSNLGNVDAFVVKLNPAGTALIYATYIGGMGADKAAAIAVDSLGQAHVAGSTASSNFPRLAAQQPLMGGSQTAFVLTLNASGNALIFSTYLGGTTWEAATSVAVDSSGSTFVAGDTQSSNFPLQLAPQPAFGGATDAFVAKLTAQGTLVFSTYLGGSGIDHAGGIAVDTNGGIYVAGGTYSTNFPIVAGAIQSFSGGNQDAFVTKLAVGFPLIYSTYLGGNGAVTPEEATSVAVDNSGNAYLTGVTNSPNFPVTAGAYQPVFNGVSDAFVAEINPAGSALVYSTFLGGSDFDWASAIGVDNRGNAYVAGYTSSFDFPVASGVQSSLGGLYDAFVSVLGPAGGALSFSTYFGGSGSDAAYSLAVDAAGNMYVGGQTNSSDLPLTTALEPANSGGSIGWLARVGVAPPPPLLPSVTSVTPATGSGGSATFTAMYSDTGGAAALTAVSLLVNGTASTAGACYVSYNPAANVFTLANDDPNTGSQTVVPGGGTAQNSQCALTGAGSSASTGGNTVTIVVRLAFLPAFTGSQTVFLYAADSGAATGWVSKGAWAVAIPASQPSAGTVSPNASTGTSQTFTFVFSDSQSAANLSSLGMLFANNVSFANACSLTVNPAAGTIGLASDNGLTTITRLLGANTSLQNSQCTVGASSIVVSGLADILTVSVTFKGTLGGLQNIYMDGASGVANTGWVQRGTYTVSLGGTPVAASVVPGSGSGPGQRFSFTVSDAGGAGYLTGLAVLIAPTFNNVGACQLVFDRNANTVSLGYENPANGATPLTPGSNVIVSNNQCSLNGLNTTVVTGTTSLIVTMDLTFRSSWFGPKNIYLLAGESSLLNSGWATVGTWTVVGGSPTADSVTPSLGTGSSLDFTFTVSDSSSQANISGLSMLITTGAPTNLANACYLVYDRTSSTIGLYDNTGTVLTTKGIGSSTTLQNTQCQVGFTGMTDAGDSVMFLIQIVFNTFHGAQTVYLQANEPGANSGWVQRGTWTVP
jgi:hypothetical protein